MSSKRTFDAFAPMMETASSSMPNVYTIAAAQGFAAFKVVAKGFVDVWNANANFDHDPVHLEYLSDEETETLRLDLLAEQAESETRQAAVIATREQRRVAAAR